MVEDICNKNSKEELENWDIFVLLKNRTISLHEGSLVLHQVYE